MAKQSLFFKHYWRRETVKKKIDLFYPISGLKTYILTDDEKGYHLPPPIISIDDLYLYNLTLCAGS